MIDFDSKTLLLKQQQQLQLFYIFFVNCNAVFNILHYYGLTILCHTPSGEMIPSYSGYFVHAVFGTAFGIWIYRSIARPLNNLIKTSDNIAHGDLTASNCIIPADEVGKVQSSMSEMIVNLREMVGKIKGATDTLACSSEELSATAVALERYSDI